MTGRVVLALLVVLILDSGCGQTIPQSLSVSDASISDASHGWSLRARRRGGLMGRSWQWESHDDGGWPSDSNDAVLGRFIERNGSSAAHVYLRPFAFRFREADTRRHIWARLVPLDAPRSRMRLAELADSFTAQLRSEPPLIASLYARSEGGVAGIAGYLIHNNVVTRIPAIREFDTSARVDASVAVTDRADASVDGAPAHMLIAHIGTGVAYPDSGQMASDAALGLDTPPESAQLALTLVRLPTRVTFTTVERSYDLPSVLIVAYWAPTRAFAGGLNDYLSVLARLRIRGR